MIILSSDHLQKRKLLAVKNLDTSASMLQKDDDFVEAVSNISKLQHNNIVELVGYCANTYLFMNT